MTPPSADLDSRLGALARLARDLGATEAAADSAALAERVREGRFYVACFGQFKRGKSTLLNALAGADLLPVGVVPVTSAVTLLRHGPERRVRVTFADGREEEVHSADLSLYVSEEGNPENRKGVRAVEVFEPAPILAAGLCLVDTPGLGSVFEGNTSAARAFIPHVDAGLVVLGADPPLSGEELSLVEEVAGNVDDFVLVMNKADRLTEEERAEGLRFASRILRERLGRDVGPICEVSAKERLATGEPTRDWRLLEARLRALAHERGADLVQAAEARGVERVARALLREIDERREALVRPLGESQERLDALRRTLADAERALFELSYGFEAEEGRLGLDFDRAQAAFADAAVPPARRELEARVRSEAGERGGPALREWALDLAREVARGRLESWRAEFQPDAERRFAEATGRFIRQANDLLDRIGRAGAADLEGLPEALAAEGRFRVRSRFFYTQLMRLTGGSPLARVLDLARSRERVVDAAAQSAGAYLERLIRANASRVAGDLAERVRESRLRVESEIRRRLGAVSAIGERALALARERRAGGEEAVERELSRLAGLRERLEAIGGEKRPSRRRG